MTEIDRIALPPGVVEGAHVEITSEGEVPVSEEARPMFRLDGVDVPPVFDQKAAEPVAEAAPPEEEQPLETAEAVVIPPQPVAQTQVIVPPVNVTVPPELIALFNSQLQLAMADTVSKLTIGIQGTLDDFLHNLPAQEADAAKKNPWLVPTLDLAIAVVGLGVLVYFVVAAVSFGNPLAKQWVAAVGMIILALFKRSPTTPLSPSAATKS